MPAEGDQPASAEVVIADTGIGIDPQQRDLIFEKFYRVGKAAQHSTSTTKFTLLFAQRSGGQAWQVDHRGNKTSQPVTLPSSHGNTGAVSTSPVGTSLFATYADYSSADPTNQAAGTRLFLEVTCK